MRLTTLATALLITLSLSACGSDEKPAAVAAAPALVPAGALVQAAVEDAPAELAPMPSGDFRIASVTLGKTVDAEGQVRQAQESFASGDKIYAAVVSVGTSEGLALAARWTAADGTQVAAAGQSLNPSTPTVTTFSIAQPEPWPTGGYRLEVSVNGRVVETRSFLVE